MANFAWKVKKYFLIFQVPVPQSFISVIQGLSSRAAIQHRRTRQEHKPLCNCCRELSWHRERDRAYARKYRNKNSAEISVQETCLTRKFHFTFDPQHEDRCKCCTVIRARMTRKKSLQAKEQHYTNTS